MANIKNVNGRNLFCNKILNRKLLAVGQEWAAADGSDLVVKIIAIDDNEITYKQVDTKLSTIQTKDSFSFQTRYCLIV